MVSLFEINMTVHIDQDLSSPPLAELGAPPNILGGHRILERPWPDLRQVLFGQRRA